MMSAAADSPKCSRCAAAGAAQLVWCSSTHRKSAAQKQTHCTQKMKNHKKEIWCYAMIWYDMMGWWLMMMMIWWETYHKWNDDMKTRCCPQQLRHPNVARVQQLVQHRWCGEAGGATSGKSRSKTVNLVNGNARKEIRRKQDGYITKVFCS